MSEIEVPDYIDLGNAENVCPFTHRGWLWYCDVHDAHGNADSADEAWACADAHMAWKIHDEGKADEGCDIQVWQRSSHERVE